MKKTSINSTLSRSDSTDHVEEQLLPTECWSTDLGDFVRLYTERKYM